MKQLKIKLKNGKHLILRPKVKNRLHRNLRPYTTARKRGLTA